MSPGTIRLNIRRAAVLTAVAALVLLLLPDVASARDRCPMEPLSGEALRSHEAEMLRLLNEERAAAGLEALQPDPGITSIARRWAAQMRDEGRADHNPDFYVPYNGGRTGEVVGHGSCSGRDAHSDLMGSPAHRSAMLSAQWSLVGIGIASTEAGALFFVEGFAAPPAGPSTAPARQPALPPRASAPPAATDAPTVVAAGSPQPPSVPDAQTAVEPQLEVAEPELEITLVAGLTEMVLVDAEASARPETMSIAVVAFALAGMLLAGLRRRLRPAPGR